MDANCNGNCPQLKTQSYAAGNQCTKPTTVKETTDGCKSAIKYISGTNNDIFQGSASFRETIRLSKSIGQRAARIQISRGVGLLSVLRVYLGKEREFWVDLKYEEKIIGPRREVSTFRSIAATESAFEQNP